MSCGIYRSSAKLIKKYFCSKDIYYFQLSTVMQHILHSQYHILFIYSCDIRYTTALYIMYYGQSKTAEQSLNLIGRK